MVNYKQAALDGGMLYTVSDVPPPGLGLILGFQHFLTMMGATALVPLLIVGSMGGGAKEIAEVISTIFFVSGLNTLIQTTFGDRLPIIQGGSFAFLAPMTAITATCSSMIDPATGLTYGAGLGPVRFLYTMRVVQGAILTTGITQVALGYTGLLVPIMKLFSPISIAPTVAMIAFGLAGAMKWDMFNCEWMWAVGCCVFVIFAQLLTKVQVPVPGLKGYKLPIFGLFPIIFTVATMWIISGIATAADPNIDPQCSTGLFPDETPTFKFPLPGQWGAPIFEGWAIGPMMGAMIVSMTESIGDYYACANLAGAPPPPGSAIVRGLAGEGWGLILCGLFGTANGTTSYGENIGAIAITKVGSRAVAQAGAMIMVILGLFPKLCAVFVMMPKPIVSSMYSVMFGMIASAGFSLLQHADMNSNRNLFILGFCLYNGLAVSGADGYFAFKFGTLGINPFGADDNFFLGFFNNTMIFSLLSGVILDNVIPGTSKERGKDFFEISNNADSHCDEQITSVYGMPWKLAGLTKNCVYLDFLYLGFKWPTKPEGGYKSSTGDCCEMLCCCIPGCKPAPAEVTKTSASAGEVATSSA